ncbi:MAG: hypothetical protein HY305_00145 [Sphingobacteriales bacterium]|nr:hypothetical protein [Sphingobacteriales bacterium]
MKKILIAIFLLGTVFTVSAQRFGGHYGGGGHFGGGRGFYGGPRVSVGIGGGYGYGGYGYGGFYPYYGYSAPVYSYSYVPTKLDLEIRDIKNDFKQKIAAAKDDDSVPRKERRAIVRQLKHDRDAAIIDAQRRYYRN